MDVTVSADTTLSIGKVVQLRPNGKVAPLPLDDVSSVKPVVTSSDGMRPGTATIGLRHVKLTDDYYLFAVPSATSSPTNRILLILAQKNGDGSFTKKYEVLTNSRAASQSLYLIKMTATQVVITGYDTASQYTVVTVAGTYDNLTVGSPSSSFMSGQSGSSQLYSYTKLKETNNKILFALLHTASVGIHSFDKASGTITPLVYYNATWFTWSARSACIYAKTSDKVAIAYGYLNTNYYVAAQILDLVYSPDGESVTSINPRTQNANIVSLGTSYPILSYNGVWVDNEAIYTWGSSGTLLTLTHVKIDWTKTDATAFTTFQPNVVTDFGNAYLDIILDSNTNSYFIVIRPSSGRFYVYSDGYKYGADFRMVPSNKTYDMSPIRVTNAASFSVSYYEGELFIAYYVTADSPNVIYIEKLAQVSDRPTPLGIAKSQSSVTIKGVCNVLDGIEVGATYFYDKFGNITRNPSDTYLGVGVSPTSILIDKTLF